MSKTPPLNQPFFVTVRQRHIDGACLSQTDQCVIARALDDAFPDCAGDWRVNGAGVSLVDHTAAGQVRFVASWGHDAWEEVMRFDRGQGFPVNRRVHFRPIAPGVPARPPLPHNGSGYAVSQVLQAAQQKWGQVYKTSGQIKTT